MTGQELLAGLSFVEERFIQEAEMASLKRVILWRQVLSVAACLCVLMAGAFAMGQFGQKSAEMEAAAPPAPEAAVEEAAPEEPAAAPKEESTIMDHAEVESAQTSAGELHHIASATLTVTEVTEAGILAVVAKTDADTELFTVGLEVTVMVDPGKVPGGKDEKGLSNYDFPEMFEPQICIENGAYDPAAGILYVEDIAFP